MQKTNNFRYMVAYLLEDKNDGDFFEKKILHVSVLPWFGLETDEQWLIESFRKKFANTHSFKAVLGDKRMFGPHHSVEVSMVSADSFMPIHRRALQWFDEIGAHWDESLVYIGEDYKPHIKHRAGYDFTPSQVFEVDSIVLIKASDDTQDDRRQVLDEVEFNND